MKPSKLYGIFIEHEKRIKGYVGPTPDVLSAKHDIVKLGGVTFSRKNVKVYYDLHEAERKLEQIHGRHLTGAFLSRLSKHGNYISRTTKSRHVSNSKTKNLISVGFTVNKEKKKDYAPYKT